VLFDILWNNISLIYTQHTALGHPCCTRHSGVVGPVVVVAVAFEVVFYVVGGGVVKVLVDVHNTLQVFQDQFVDDDDFHHYIHHYHHENVRVGENDHDRDDDHRQYIHRYRHENVRGRGVGVVVDDVRVLTCTTS